MSKSINRTINTTSQALENTVEESVICEFLTNNPNFFTNKSDLLLTMEIPHESGQAISLLERQVNLLREQSNEKQENIEHFIANAKANYELFGKIRQVILSLLKTTSMGELSTLIESQPKNDFSASVSKLIHISELKEDDKTALKPFLKLKKTACNILTPEQNNALFPNINDDIVSAAIVPINIENNTHLLLAIGSTKKNHFHAGQDTLFLDFIGEVLAAHSVSINRERK